MYEFFNQSHTFYTLKEIEKEGSKYAKISSMLIKDIVQQLIDDNLINCEKCGTTNLYWCFKFDKIKNLQVQYNNYQKRLKEKQLERDQLIEKIQLGKLQRVPKGEFGDRSKLIKQFTCLNNRKQQLDEELQKYGDNDPQLIEALNEKNARLILAIETYTDDIESLIYYFTKVSLAAIEELDLRNELGIPTEFAELPRLQ